LETIRLFDPESQRSSDTRNSIELLPGREYPTDHDAINQFRTNFRRQFEGDPQKHLVYREISKGNLPTGLDYFWPLFYSQTDTLFEHLLSNATWVLDKDFRDSVDKHWAAIVDRHKLACLVPERLPLPPEQLYAAPAEISRRVNSEVNIFLGTETHEQSEKRRPGTFWVEPRNSEPYQAITKHLQHTRYKTLLAFESVGKQDIISEVLRGRDMCPTEVDGWTEFARKGGPHLATVTCRMERGAVFQDLGLEVITETQIFGERTTRAPRRTAISRDPESIIKSLAELKIDDPVVHEDHGVGRYRGLKVMRILEHESELMVVDYQGGDKLYVPILNLHLVNRYLGGDPETAPLHKLGSEQWARAKDRAAKRTRDTAAELLEIQAIRASRAGASLAIPSEEYSTFVSTFVHEETPDQITAMEDVLSDLVSDQPMDRLVCGDVGFGKTEIALRAAFVAIHNGKQVALLVPTTLLAQQHFDTFLDRFSDQPVSIRCVSRLQTNKEVEKTLASLRNATLDIVIGTHRLLQPDVSFMDLGLLIIDEEHRFGVRQKEHIKKLRKVVDILTLTATPIPRTLNFTMTGVRDISLIATPPEQRVAIKTFIRIKHEGLIREACLREINRGGQVFFLHNQVKSIERVRDELQILVPEATIGIAHGQMPESELEVVMRNFQQQRFNLMVCSTIIESGIDIPNANTILIDRADRLGLAQLHQIRGRVGRSNRQAFAYLLIPDEIAITKNATKRLDAIASLEGLGAGFALASHDLEIRGAGELLGEEQSGTIDDIGFSLYADYLNRAIRDLAKLPNDNKYTLYEQIRTEIDLDLPILFPDSYLPDVHARLLLYKRIANAQTVEDLYDLQLETLDRFGLLPEAAKSVFAISDIKLTATGLGIEKIKLGDKGGFVKFSEHTALDPVQLVDLIESSNNEINMRGTYTLGVTTSLPLPQDKIAYIKHLLATLQSDP
ncbi:MAG: transcription-repair coupling factor, partial [Arenicellales bacterium]|nr:transcription-repair coupling factor [Arenicellales bacterium]